jgi:hypothetical protein
VVRADLECLVSAHDEASLAVLRVLQETNISGAALLPLAALLDELEELGSHLEYLFLGFLVGLGLDLFGKLDDGLEVHIFRLGRLIILREKIRVSFLALTCRASRLGEAQSCSDAESLTSSSFFSAAAAAAASRWALLLPEVSPRSSSSFFSFLAPPPNMENTADEVTDGASAEPYHIELVYFPARTAQSPGSS